MMTKTLTRWIARLRRFVARITRHMIRIQIEAAPPAGLQLLKQLRELRPSPAGLMSPGFMAPGIIVAGSDPEAAQLILDFPKVMAIPIGQLPPLPQQQAQSAAPCRMCERHPASIVGGDIFCNVCVLAMPGYLRRQFVKQGQITDEQMARVRPAIHAWQDAWN
jgi:hypothetical protein